MTGWFLPGRQRRAAVMTVAPRSPSEATASPQPGKPAPAWLGADLQRRVHLAAAASGLSAAAVCEMWIREGLERFEAHEPAEDPDGSGRCSLRTGTCTLGPVPLPVQQ